MSLVHIWYLCFFVALVGVTQAGDIEFDAVHPGEWMLHCHLPHHMMNQMVSMESLARDCTERLSESNQW